MKFGHLMTLRRFDGRAYMTRWGFAGSLFGVYLHRFDAADPGLDLHDHPFRWASIVLHGGYVEERCPTVYAPVFAAIADRMGPGAYRGVEHTRMAGTVGRFGLHEAHRIVRLLAPTVWTLVFRGPVRADRAGERSPWGFWLADGWIDEKTYDETVRADRRDLWNEVG